MKERLLFPYKSEKNEQESFEAIHNIYSRIVDEQSKEIYRCRLLMTLTGDIGYIRSLVLTTEAGKEFEDFLKKQNKIYIYGAGIRGNRVLQMFPEMNWKGYIDRKQKGICNGLNIFNPEGMELEEDAVVLITNLEEFNEIKESLIALGVEKKQIFILNDFEKKAHKCQYFEERCIKNFKDTQGAFLDAGCFDGGDCIRFSESILNHNNPMYAFEPDEVNYYKCKEILNGYKNAEVFNVGLSDKKQQTYFLSDKGECSRIAEQGDCLINIDTIDSMIGEKEIGFIKMDIEGNEKKAILGARAHIEKDKPNMMISVYHNLEDVIEIPKMLLEMNSNYKFAFGHYSVYNADTVLYVF